MYTAAVLTHMSSDLLKWMIRATIKLEDLGYKFKTEQGCPLPHHMTINLGEFDSELNDIKILGLKADLWIEEFVYNDTLGIAAAPVSLVQMSEGDLFGEKVKSKNKCPHITLCIKDGVKPMLSNKLLEVPHPHTQRFKLEERCRLDTRIHECE